MKFACPKCHCAIKPLSTVCPSCEHQLIVSPAIRILGLSVLFGVLALMVLAISLGWRGDLDTAPKQDAPVLAMVNIPIQTNGTSDDLEVSAPVPYDISQPIARATVLYIAKKILADMPQVQRFRIHLDADGYSYWWAAAAYYSKGSMRIETVPSDAYIAKRNATRKNIDIAPPGMTDAQWKKNCPGIKRFHDFPAIYRPDKATFERWIKVEKRFQELRKDVRVGQSVPPKKIYAKIGTELGVSAILIEEDLTLGHTYYCPGTCDEKEILQLK